MLTAEQIRAGRALLRWQQATLAERADVSLETIKRLERLDGPLEQVRVGTVEAIRRAFMNAGVEFIDENGGGPGVRLKRSANTADSERSQNWAMRAGDGD